MAIQLSADALDKLKCTFVTEILNKIKELQLGFNCTTYSDDIIRKMANFVFMLESGCIFDTCDIDAFTSKLPSVYVGDCGENIICDITLTEVTPDSCAPFTLIRL